VHPYDHWLFGDGLSMSIPLKIHLLLFGVVVNVDLVVGISVVASGAVVGAVVV